MQIFSENSARYAELGITVIPCHGKQAAIRWKKYQIHLPSLQETERWLDDFAECNIAAITGSLSGITVVDCDDPNRPLESLFEEFGRITVVVSTPRGGKHLYYRHNGEKCITKYKGGLIDIRGEGGYLFSPTL